MLKRIVLILLIGLLITVPLVMRSPGDVSAISALVLTNPTPADGSVVSESTGQIKVRFEDPAVKVLQTDVVLKVDGKIVYHTITYDTTTVYDTCGIPSTTYNYNSGWINGPVMTSGTHDVSVTVTDIVGNTAIMNWQYAVDGFEITTVPENNFRVGSLNPQITVNAANLYAKESDILSATLKVNGADRPVNIQRMDKDHWTVTANVYNLTNDVPVTVTGDISNNRGINKSYSFTFTPSISPPDIYINYVLDGAVYEKLTTNNERLVRLSWYDSDGINPSSLVMTVDQNPVSASIDGAMIVGPELNNGRHTINVRLRDKLGNEASKIYTVTFKVPPMLLTTQRLYSSLQPLLSFPLDVMGTGLDPGKTVLMVDGTQYPVTINGTTVTSQMPKMENETEHNVTLTAVDKEGLSSPFNLKLSVNTFGEMPYNNNGCAGCHDARYYSSQNKWAHTKSPDSVAAALLSGNTSPNAFSCDHCHGLETAKDSYCYYCHDIVDRSSPHDSGFSLTSPMPPTPALSKSGTDCLSCHAPLGRITNDWWPGAFTLPLSLDYPYDPAEKTDYPYKHLIYSPHNIVYEAVYSTCKDCHGSNLTRTHNNKKAKTTGKTMECGTCHLSQDPMVKASIVNKKTGCSSCHNLKQGHDALHTSSLDSKCTTCHKDTLTQDHVTRTDSAGNKYTCDTCHSSTNTKVLRTIAARSKNCEGCHTQAHNLLLIDKVPADIPLYDAVRWTKPEEASIFTGENGIPSGYEAGQVVFSARQNLALSDVWLFYNTCLTDTGWKLNSGVPAGGATYFSADFIKGYRSLTVRYYSTVSNDGTGELSPAGAKIEIWYK